MRTIYDNVGFNKRFQPGYFNCMMLKPNDDLTQYCGHRISFYCNYQLQNISFICSGAPNQKMEQLRDKATLVRYHRPEIN